MIDHLSERTGAGFGCGYSTTGWGCGGKNELANGSYCDWNVEEKKCQDPTILNTCPYKSTIQHPTGYEGCNDPGNYGWNSYEYESVLLSMVLGVAMNPMKNKIQNKIGSF